jgi:hypothetical protein
VCDGSPLAAMLIIGHGSRGGSTSPSVVTAGEGDPSERRAMRVLRWWPSHGSKCSPQSSDVYLVGGERGADPALRAARPMASALPWMTSASGAEIRSPNRSGDSWWSVWPSDGGAVPGGSSEEGCQHACSTRNQRPQHTDPVT